MATQKQRLATQKSVENGGNITEAMRYAGYSEKTINNPSNLTQSKGFRAILEDSGLTETLVASALVEDIEKKPQNRVKELALASDILGMRKHETIVQQAVMTSVYQIEAREFLTNPEYMKVLQAFEGEMKKMLVSKR
ncbi:MAG: hypothetical protein AAB681_02395 [Patescibacteria group bacterium]